MFFPLSDLATPTVTADDPGMSLGTILTIAIVAVAVVAALVVIIVLARKNKKK